jgi:hypothetical protein
MALPSISRLEQLPLVTIDLPTPLQQLRVIVARPRTGISARDSYKLSPRLDRRRRGATAAPSRWPSCEIYRFFVFVLDFHGFDGYPDSI